MPGLDEQGFFFKVPVSFRSNAEMMPCELRSRMSKARSKYRHTVRRGPKHSVDIMASV